MEQITNGSEAWRLPFGPHLMEGNGIPVQLWGPLATQLGISIVAAAQTYDALNPSTAPQGGWDTAGIHVTEAAHRNVSDIVGQASRAWHPSDDPPSDDAAATDEEDGEEPPPPQG
eukprot:11815813-Heterocapsa_arctica.AAC.1